MNNDELADNVEVIEGDEIVQSGKFQSYSDDFVGAAILLVESNGGNIKGTAKKLDMPPSTLREWVGGNYRNKHGAITRDIIKADMIPLLFSGAKEFITSANDNIEGMSPYQRVIAAGVYTDKLIALSGIPTQVKEVRVLGALEHRITAWGAADDDDNLDK